MKARHYSLWGGNEVVTDSRGRIVSASQEDEAVKVGRYVKGSVSAIPYTMKYSKNPIPEQCLLTGNRFGFSERKSNTRIKSVSEVAA